MQAAGRPIRSLSVLLPTWQGVEFLERVLAGLAAQEVDLPWDVLVIDSGSTDGTLEILARHAQGFPVPLAVRGIDKLEFDHGDTRNLLAALSSGDLLVFLTQDAIPVGPRWLATLARNFDDPRVAAVTCRNVPRPDAHAVTKLLSAADPGYAAERREVSLPPAEVYAAMRAEEKRLLYSFNDVASAIRRELWELHPFPRTWFGEDVLMARALLEAGYRVVYDARATVEHSHDYEPPEAFARAAIDGRFNAEWLGRVAIGSDADAMALCKRLEASDRAALAAAGHAGPALAALARQAGELRRATFLGLAEGGRAERRRPATALLPSPRLRVLFAVHGFPPDTWAGTEVYTLNLAHELARRGHEVAIFTRAPAQGGEPDFGVREETFEGLRVLRMTHRLAHPSLRASYREPRAEEAFRRVLAEVRPDVVHFQHLIHTSIGLVDAARQAGCATLVHCHDYWAICPRVQLIRPDGVRCSEGMGAGCYLCVKEKAFEMIPTLKQAGERAGDVLTELFDGLGKRDFRELAERGDAVLSAYAACDLQISPSRFLRDKLLATGAFQAERFLYSDNGMRTDHVRALAKRPSASGRLRVGFVGSLVWYKGGEVMLAAFERLGAAPLELHVFGDFQPERDAHHAELQARARASAAAVVFHGRFPNSELAEVYAGIDVLLVPSIWYENSPITIHEAFLAGTPVVASDIGGMAEYVRDGVDGLTFRAGDGADLARVLRRLVEEEGLLARLSRSFPPVKTIAEDAAAMEFRYRGLVARRRAAGPATLLDASGAEARRRFGPVELQGAELALLRPGGAALEYELCVASGAKLEVRVDVRALAGEGAVELGGRVLWDGSELGRIAPFRAGARDEVRRFAFALSPAGGQAPARLRIESALAPGGPEAFLRVERVVVREEQGS